MGMEVIKNVYKRKLEERENLRLNLLEDVNRVLGKLLREVRFEEAYIFGSLTRPYRFSEASDIDIAFKALDKDRLFFTVGFLSRELERDVNVVEIENIHFKDKILREGIRWKKD